MNIRLIKKIQQRLVDLEQQADTLKDQISNLDSFNDIKDSLKKDKLQFDLDDTLSRIKHINAANKIF